VSPPRGPRPGSCPPSEAASLWEGAGKLAPAGSVTSPVLPEIGIRTGLPFFVIFGWFGLGCRFEFLFCWCHKSYSLETRLYSKMIKTRSAVPNRIVVHLTSSGLGGGRGSAWRRRCRHLGAGVAPAPPTTYCWLPSRDGILQ
jgi:hypothetical protein